MARWRGVGAAAVVFLAVAWLAAPPGVPLYDGIGFPDEPYRYVVPPAGEPHTKPPTVASGRVVAAGGRSGDPLEILSAEQGPQVQVALERAALTGPAGAAEFRVSATPVADTPGSAGQSGAPPPRLDGNIYRLAAVTAAAAPVAYAPNGVGFVVLRATTARQPGPQFLYRARAGAGWRVLETDRVGLDVYQARLVGLGDYVLGYPVAAVASAGQAPVQHRSPLALVLIGGLVLLLAASVLAVRLARSRSSGPAPP
jgi:hypothetical protein